MTEYGLPSLRDKDGELQAVEHTYEWGGSKVTIKLRPPTISEQEEYENLGEETSADELRDIVDEHLVKPEIPTDEDLTMRELNCYIEGIVDFSAGGRSGLAAEIEDELEARQEETGN